MEQSKSALMDRINAYRAQNNLERIEYLSLVLESYWCSLPENNGKCVPVDKLPRGAMGFLRGGMALLQNIFYGEFAPQWLAEMRAGQCKSCIFNSFPDHTGFNKWADEIAVASVGSRKTTAHNELGLCAVCTCPLRAKVWYKGTVSFTPEQEKSFKSVDCWQLKLPRNKKG